MIKKTGVMDKRLLIAKNSIMMLVMLVIIFLAVMAWYFVNGTVTAGSTTASASSVGELKMALPEADGSYPTDESKYKNSLSAAELSAYVHPLFLDTTSDGKDFILPDFSNAEDIATGKVVNISGEWEKAHSYAEAVGSDQIDDKDYQFLSFDLYLRSEQNDISAEASSYLQSDSEASNRALNNPTEAKKSSYGNFSVDSLVGAIRTSIVGANVRSKSGSTVTYTNGTGTTTNYAAASSARFLWVPRPDIHLKVKDGNTPLDVGSWQLETTNLPAETSRHDYYTGNYDENDNKVSVTRHEGGLTYAHASTGGKTGGANGTQKVPVLGDDYQIAGSFDGDSNAQTITFGAKEYYLYKVTVNVWIEGTDSEARRAMDGAKFNLFLSFA